MQSGPGWRRGRENISSSHPKMERSLFFYGHFGSYKRRRKLKRGTHGCKYILFVVTSLWRSDKFTCACAVHSLKWQLGRIVSRIHYRTCISLIAYEARHVAKSSLTSERITITVPSTDSISIPVGVFDQSEWWKDYERPSYPDGGLEVSSSIPIHPPSLSPERFLFPRTHSSS